MQIGFVEQRQLDLGKDQAGQPKIAQWLEVIIKAPGVREFSLKMTAGPQEQGKQLPNFILYYRTNQRKGEQFRDIKAGAMWLQTSKDGQTEYLSGHIETPAILGGKLRIAMFNAAPRYQGEQVNWLYDVIWNADDATKQANDDLAPQYGQAVPQSHVWQGQQQQGPTGPPSFNGGGAY